MCGIAGAIYLKKYYDFEDDLENMSQLISHRGPDDQGVFYNNNNQVHFAHRRLSILDLSSLGHQPMHHEDYVITYNGEIYNYIELRNELIKLGYNFISETDTEVLLKGYCEWGSDVVNKLNGMWAFAIYDPSKNHVFCSRDRFGIKPFYYTVIDSNRFYFASEIKAFTKIKDWNPVLNNSIAYDFLKNSVVNHTENTFFQNVFELRGGNNIIINLKTGKYNKIKYYDPELIIDKNKNWSINKFKNLLIDSIKLRLRSDVKIGSALSGGLDSSTIVSVVNNLLKKESKTSLQECVSACYDDIDNKIDESKYVDILKNNKELIVHKTIPDWDRLMSNLDKVIWHQDEPFSTLSIFARI